MPDAPATPTTPSPATPTAPTAAPASTPAGQTPAPATPSTPAAPAGPQSVREARQSLFKRGERLPATAAEAKAAAGHHAQTQPREPDGKFAATDPSAATAPDPNAPAATAPSATPPAEGAAPAPSADPAAPTAATTVPEGMVRIDIPEGHALRHRGDHYLAPKEFEDINRWAINNTIRHQEVESAAKNARDWQQYANQLKAELQATREFTGGIFNDPTVIAQIQDIRQTYGDEAARRFEVGLWQEQQAKVEKLTAEQQQETQIAEMGSYVDTFRQQAFAAAQRRYPEWTHQEVENALAAYGSWVWARVQASGGDPLKIDGANQLKLQEFISHADPVYLQNPRARAAAQARADAKREQERTAAAKAEADRLAAEQQKQLEEVVAQRKQYPWLNAPVSAQPGHVAVPGDDGPRTVHDARRALTQRGRRRVAV